MSSDSESDVPWDPTLEPDRGHPSDPTNTFSSVTTRARTRAGNNNNGTNSNNSGNNSNNSNNFNGPTPLSANAPAFDPSDMSVIDNGLDLTAIGAILDTISADPAPESLPQSLVIDDDDEMSGESPTEFDSTIKALKIQVPHFTWSPDLEALIWRGLDEGEITRLINRTHPPWSFEDYIEYKQRRDAVLSDLSDDIQQFLIRCGQRQDVSRARKALELIERSYNVLKNYASQPGPEKFKQLQDYINLFDRARDLFNKFANAPSGCGRLNIRELLTDLSLVQFNLKYPGGIEIWSRFLHQFQANGRPKPLPRSRNRKRQLPTFNPRLLPSLPPIPEIDVDPASDNTPPTLQSIIDQLQQPGLSSQQIKKLRSNLVVIQQQLSTASQDKGYSTANAAKEALEQNDIGDDGSSPPPRKRQRLNSSTRERLGSVVNLATQQV